MTDLYLNTKRVTEDLVSIVLPHAGPLDPLKKCIADIEQNTTVAYELIVVADKCDSETLTYLRSLYEKGVRLALNQELMGPTAAINTGFTAAQGEYICLLDADVGLAPGWLDALKAALSAHPEYGWVGLQAKQAPGFFAATSLFTQQAFQRVGLWDEQFSDSFNDDDWIRRMWQAGFSPHTVSEPKVDHPDGHSVFAALYGRETQMPRFHKTQEAFIEKWGEEGGDWDKLPIAEPPGASTGHRIDWIRSKVDVNDVILEVGCASNPIWKGTPYKVTRLDKSINQGSPDVVAEAENLPFEAESYDIVVLSELLEHVPDPQLVLSEAVRVARKKVVVTVPWEHAWPAKLKPFWNQGHVRFYTPKSLKEEIAKGGLSSDIEEIRCKGWVWLGTEIYCGTKERKMPGEVKARFIGGIGACGGGILRRWLNLHPDVYCVGQTGVIPNSLLYDLTPLAKAQNGGLALIELICDKLIFPTGNHEREVVDRYLSELFNSPALGSRKETANFIYKLFTRLAKLNNKTIWVENTPMNVFFSDRLREYFGDEFRLIWVEREPRDNICCIAFSRAWGPNDLLGAIDHWAFDIKQILSSVSSIPEFCIRVDYEDFVYNQVEVGKKICEFLQIPWHKNLETPVTTDADIGRYKREFTLVTKSPPAPEEEPHRFVWTDRFSWTRNMMEELTKNKPGAQVVDIGCNECPITRELPNCTWVDIKSYGRIVELMQTTPALICRRDPATGSFLTEGWQSEGATPIPKARYIQATAESLPFEYKQFDVAIATQLLAYPENPVAVLKEIKRIAKRAIITVRNEQDWDPKYRTNPDPNMRFYTEEMLRRHLEEAGIINCGFQRLDYNGWSFFAVVSEDEDAK